MNRNDRIVIIGAGIVGCNLADQLTAMGCTNVTVLDQGALPAPGGSTSHAPGGMFQVNVAQVMTQFAQYSVQRYGELDLDGEPCFFPVGSIEVATTPARWEDLKRKRGIATSWSVEAALLTPEECAARMPLLDPARILGGLYVPTDGVAKPVRTVEALARLATSRGARFHGNTEVTGFERANGRVSAVLTAHGRFEADVVVCCAGIWGPKVGRLAGVAVPLVPMEHQYTISTPLPALAGVEREVTLPLMRHQDRDLYFRQHFDRYGVGSYQNAPRPIDAEDLLPVEQAPVMPSVVPFTPEDFTQAWQDAIALKPGIAEGEIGEAINGIFSFTADGFPILGEAPELPGFWLAEAVWITHAGGVAKAVAEWLVEGVSGIDLRQCDVRRFEPYALSPAYIQERSCQSYIEVYDVKHPMEPMENPRPLRTSPFFPREVVLGGVFLEASGWERPQWFDANAPLLDHSPPAPTHGAWEGRYWSPIVAAEHHATRSGVAMYDMNSLTKVEVTGPGALPFLQRLVTGNLDRSAGSVVYTLMLDEHGGIKSDMTVARLGATQFQIGCNGPRDVAWFEEHLPADGSVCVRNITGGTCCIGLWGPRARDVLQTLTRDDLSDEALPYFRTRRIFVREVPVTAMRLSYVGELGWELYTSADYGLRLWDLLWEAGRPFGVIPGGRGAFDSLRVEKGYRFYGRDMWSEQDPYEAGLGFTVNAKKGDFIGREAVLRRKAEGPRQRVVTLTLDDPERVVMGNEPVYAGGRPVGFVTSAAYGYTVGRGVAYAWVTPECAALGTPLAVEYFGELLAATVRPDTLVDPEMTRLRGTKTNVAV